MHRLLAAAALAVGALLTAPASAQDAALARAMRGVLAEHFDAEGPGAAVAIVQAGEPPTLVTYGLADVERGRPITRRTLFDLASVSKQFTAGAVLLLAADGELDVDADVADVVDGYDVPVRGRAVTIADLVHHVSGLPDYTGDAWDGSDEEFAALSNDDHVAWLGTQRPVARPGVEYVYNNSGYVLLASVIEHASGMRFEAFVRERLFTPAGMRDVQVMDRVGERYATAAIGYAVDDGVVARSFSPSIVTGDGNIYASIDDMAAWLAALDGTRVFTATLKRQLWTTGTLDDGEPVADDDGYGYGYGWSLDDDSGMQWHSGSWYGTSTYVLRDPANGRAVVVLSNDENADVEAIAMKLLAL